LLSFANVCPLKLQNIVCKGQNKNRVIIRDSKKYVKIIFSLLLL